ncbi:hypothetical protein VTO42DRAFT_2727 [Malbranchea cinnamomea]
MAPFLSKRLQCFYCGRRSSTSFKGPVRQWKCQECQAVNYLDEKGEITDPPVPDTSPESKPPQYARPLPKSESDSFSSTSSQSSLFCSTCLKNQRLLTQALASYLPSPSHPEYAAYEASYPAYRRNLEARYPQVCEKCEPRVRERIRQAGYAAKADHLRRMMEQSRSGRLQRHRHYLGWRSLLLYTGAVAYWVSVAGQLTWDVVSVMSAENASFELDLDISTSQSVLKSCVSLALKHAGMAPECGATAQPYAGFALLLGVLGVWWNPKLRYKVEGRSGRLAGLREYYQIQIVMLVVRFAVWTCSNDPLVTDFNPRLPTAIHILMAILTIISVITSRLAIKFDTTPVVKWQDNIEPLVLKTQEKHNLQPSNPPESQEPLPSARSSLESFPIANLAPPRRANPQPYAPLTPPDEAVNDEDVMDWTPSQQSFQPNHNRSYLTAQSHPAPSPFQGKLPPAPKPPSWQLRSRNPQPAPVPIENKPNPFHNAPILHPTPSLNDETQHSSGHTEMVMVPPKFFPPSDHAADTGLESLFDKTFTLADEPSEVRESQRASRRRSKSTSATTPGNRISHALKCALLTATLLMSAATRFSTISRNTVEAFMLAICFVNAGFSLLESLMKPLSHWGPLEFLLPILELVACSYLAILHSHGPFDPILFDRVGKGLTAFMLGQELMALRSIIVGGQTTTPASSPPNTQPAERVKKDPAPATSSKRAEAPRRHEASPSKPRNQFRGSNNNTDDGLTSNNTLGSYHAPTTPNNGLLRTSFGVPDGPRNSTYYPPSSALPPQNNAASLQNSFNSAGNSFGDSTQSIPYPPPFNSFSRPPQDSFSSFHSLPEKVLSTASTVSTTDYASSSTSEPPSPQLRARQQTPHSTLSQRFGSPSITGLSLEDSPIRRPTQSRYSLRNRRR